MKQHYYLSLGLAVFFALLMSSVVLPFGYDLDTQLLKVWFVIPLVIAISLVPLWRLGVDLELPIGIFLIFIGSISAATINFIHGAELTGFAFAVYWFSAALCVWSVTLWLKKTGIDRTAATVFFEYFLLIFTALTLLLALPGKGYFHLSDTQVFGWFGLPTTHGGFAQPNNFGSFLASVAGYMIWFKCFSDSAKEDAGSVEQFTKFVFFAVLVGVVFQSGSRVGQLGIFSVLAVFLLVAAVQRNIEAIKHLTICFIVFGIFGFVYLADFSGGDLSVNSSLEVSEDSIDIRVGFWIASIVNLLNSTDSVWLGFGFNSFNVVYPQAYQLGSSFLLEYPYVSGTTTFHPHNEVIYVLLAGGIVGGVFVLLPIIGGVIVQSGGRMSLAGILNVCPLMPVGLHCMTELPLWQSGMHWVFTIGFLIVSGLRYSESGSKVFNVPRSLIWMLPGAVLFLALSFAALDVVRVGHSARINQELVKNEKTVNQYIQFRAGQPELEHWAFTEGASHRFILELYDRALADNRFDILEGALPQVKRALQYYNTIYAWNLLASGYASLEMTPELIGFINYVETLNPDHAEKLRKALLTSN